MAMERIMIVVLLLLVGAVEASLLRTSPQQAHRQLPGDYSNLLDFSGGDLQGEEIAFLLGILFCLLFLLCILCSCCCRAGSCSLWDLVAVACLWEICCDNRRNAGDFILL